MTFLVSAKCGSHPRFPNLVTLPGRNRGLVLTGSKDEEEYVR